MKILSKLGKFCGGKQKLKKKKKTKQKLRPCPIAKKQTSVSHKEIFQMQGVTKKGFLYSILLTCLGRSSVSDSRLNPAKETD